MSAKEYFNSELKKKYEQIGGIIANGNYLKLHENCANSIACWEDMGEDDKPESGIISVSYTHLRAHET